jgi:HAD superfamily hydrolase (TIGR01509 family)
MQNMKRMLILDFDGVLVDSEPVNFASWDEAFYQVLGIRLDDPRKWRVGLSLSEIYELWSQAGISDEKKAKLLALKRKLFFSMGAETLRPMPGSLELIRKAHSLGWYVAVASRATRNRVHQTFELMGMPALFDVILGGEDCIHPETDRKDHAKAARLFGIDPADCIVIEDSESGVRDARAAGIGWVIGLTTSLDAATLLAAGAHEVVGDLEAVQLIKD